MNCKAQSKLNYGLQQVQQASTLPQSKALYNTPVLKKKIKPETILAPATDGIYNLTAGWELTDDERANAPGEAISTPNFNSSHWYNATVPGTVLTTLVQQGVYPDPYFGLNNLHIPDSLCRKNWWYRINFKIPAAEAKKEAWLSFEGINYGAEIWLNGKYLGQMKGAFKMASYQVKKYLNAHTENVLAVHILPPPNPGIPHEESPMAGTGPNGGTLCLDGPTFISSEGWDWVPGIRDRNMGIWQNVSLKFGGPVTINAPQVITTLPLPDTTQACISVGTELHNSTSTAQQVILTGQVERLHFQKKVTLGPGEKRRINFEPSALIHPRLWWPNGYGNPELYTLKLTVKDKNGVVADIKTVRFGVRELSYELSVDIPEAGEKRVNFIPSRALKDKHPIFDNIHTSKASNGVTIARLKPDVNPSLVPVIAKDGAAPYLIIKVNGQRIYCKGGNWGMDDAMKNTSRQHLEPYFKLHRDAHFNMVRNWTGESTEQTFYDLCDEYGLLVWNDFWLSTEGYNLNVKDNALFVANAKDVIQRFRNHPSIAIWCPRNEGYAPPELEEQLATLVVQEDGTRYYQPNSRYLNLRTSGPWHYLRQPGEYDKLANGFSTELGTPSVPTAASMKKMMAKEDLWPIGDVWYYHDFHDGQKDYLADMDSLYGKATSLEDFCKKAQLLNYNSHRAMFESWTGKLWNNTTGLLLWMTHPAWPSTVWQTYSWDYETTGSYFASMKACEPVHVQLNTDDEVVLVNTSLQAHKGCSVTLTLYDLAGRIIYTTSATVYAGANRLTPVFKNNFRMEKDGTYLIRLQLTDSRKQILSVNDYWRNYGRTKDFSAFNALPFVNLSLKEGIKSQGANKITFTITNNTKVPAIAVKLNLLDNKTKKVILPAYFSDGYFNLLPGETRKLTVESSVKNGVVVAGGYNVNHEIWVE